MIEASLPASPSRTPDLRARRRRQHPGAARPCAAAIGLPQTPGSGVDSPAGLRWPLSGADRPTIATGQTLSLARGLRRGLATAGFARPGRGQSYESAHKSGPLKWLDRHGGPPFSSRETPIFIAVFLHRSIFRTRISDFFPESIGGLLR